jgi:hypothetical protein
MLHRRAPSMATREGLADAGGAKFQICLARFISKSERERARLVREARARYDSIFPPADPAREQRDKTPVRHTVNDSDASRSDGSLVS